MNHNRPHFYFVTIFLILSILSSFQFFNNYNYASAKEIILERKLTLEINPGCKIPEVCTNGSLLHIRSDSDKDSLHFIWNFIGAPSLLLARTSLDSKLAIDWPSLIYGKTSSVSFDPPEVQYSFGTSLTQIWTFDDPSDQNDLEKVNQTGVHGWDTNRLLWERHDEDFVNRSDLIKFSVIAKKYDIDNLSLGPKEYAYTENRYAGDLGPEGYVKITIQVRNTDGYGDILPYMRHNGNTSQVDVSLSRSNFNDTLTPKTRIALGYTFVQDIAKLNESTGDKDIMKIQKTKALDDEHSPGVFEVYSIRTPVLNKYDQSYLEWKPICYIAEVRDITDSVDVRVFPLVLGMGGSLNGTFLWGYYGANVSTLIVQSTNISFGTQGDGFFNKTGHLSWTYMTGYGPPPSDSVSLLVILTLAIGLGVPSIIIIIAIIYLFTKRLSTPKDDLLLGR